MLGVNFFVCLFKWVHISVVEQLKSISLVSQTSQKKGFLRRGWKEVGVTVSRPVTEQDSGDK